MQLGSLSVELLSEGRFEIFGDGHINRAPGDHNTSSDLRNSSDYNSATVGINPVLIQTGRYNILLDAGLGWGLDAGSRYIDVSNISTNLAIFDLTPDDITHVILSHLHYDHAAGCSFTDANQQITPTFSNATYVVHQKEWEYALTQVDSKQPLFGADYQLDDFYRLVADGRVEFLSGRNNNILEGITVIRTGGHTPGHQIVHLQSEDVEAYYFGDLLPNSSQLNHYAMGGMDVHTIEAKKQKVQLLKKACGDNALLLFYHSRYGKVGRLVKNKDKQYALTDVKQS